MWELLGGIYIIGMLAGLIWLMGVVGRETTAHGQEILLSIGCLAVIGWPLTLGWLIVVLAFEGVAWLGRKLKLKL